MGEVILLSLTASLNPTLVAATTVMLLLDKGLSRLGGGECRESRLLERDQAAGELEQREVVLVLLAPANEDPAVAVEP